MKSKHRQGDNQHYYGHTDVKQPIDPSGGFLCRDRLRWAALRLLRRTASGRRNGLGKCRGAEKTARRFASVSLSATLGRPLLLRV